MASIDRTAYPRLKRVVPVRELNEAFTPTADEVAWAVDRSLGDSNLLSLVVLLKSYQRLGYFPNITDRSGQCCRAHPRRAGFGHRCRSGI